MLLLGLLLIGAAGAFAGLLIAQYPAGPPDAVSVLGFELGRLSTAQAFLSGIALAPACCLGIALAAGSVRRRHRRRTAWRNPAWRNTAWRDASAARRDGASDDDPDDMERTAPLEPLPFPWSDFR